MNLNLNKCMRNEIIIKIRYSSSDGVHRHVENRRCRWYGWIRQRGLRPGAGLPTAEQNGQAEDGASDHGSGGGEDPVAEDPCLSCSPGLLSHCFQFLNQNVGVEFAGDFGPETFNC